MGQTVAIRIGRIRARRRDISVATLRPRSHWTGCTPQRDAVDAYLQPCLAPDWIRRRTAFPIKTTDTNFERGQDDPIVRIRETYYQDTQEYILRIDVDAPQSAAAAPAN